MVDFRKKDVFRQKVDDPIRKQKIQLSPPRFPLYFVVQLQRSLFKTRSYSLKLKAESARNGGTYKSNGVQNGIHRFGVDATVNWKLDWKADINGEHVRGENWSGNRRQKLMINNIDTTFSTDRARNEIIATDKGAVVLSNRDFTIIKRKNGHSNIGESADNQFEVKWRVGTQERPQRGSTPRMNEKSLLEQQIGSEAFKFDVIFTLSQDDISDISYFSKCSTEEYGLSPSAYRAGG